MKSVNFHILGETSSAVIYLQNLSPVAVLTTNKFINGEASNSANVRAEVSVSSVFNATIIYGGSDEAEGELDGECVGLFDGEESKLGLLEGELLADGLALGDVLLEGLLDGELLSDGLVLGESLGLELAVTDGDELGDESRLGLEDGDELTLGDAEGLLDGLALLLTSTFTLITVPVMPVPFFSPTSSYGPPGE